MALFGRSERGIGRGERPESRLEAPFFAVFMVFCAVGLFVFHVYVGEASITVAVAISMLAFGTTVLRVEFGVYILVLAMLLSPEISTGSLGAAAEREINLRYDDLLIIVLFLGVLVKLAFEGRIMLWRPNPINVGILAYFSVCIISTLIAWGISVPAWDRNVAFFVMLKMLEFYIIFLMVGLAITENRQIPKQLRCFIAVALVVSIYGIFSIGKLDRIGAPFEAGGTEPNTMGGYLMIVICLAVGLYLHAPNRLSRLFFAGMAITAFVPFVETLSRASYISLIVALCAAALIGRRFKLLVALAIFLALTPVIMPQDVIDRVQYTFQQESGVPIVVAGRETNLQVDKSTYERVYVWQKVRYNLRVWPWFGGGVSWDTVLDSQYARVIIETGLVGFAAFLLLLYRLVKTTYQSYRWSSDWYLRGLGLGICSATVGLITHGTGTISFLIVRIMEPYWFLVALAVVARENALREHGRKMLEFRRNQAKAAAPAPAAAPPPQPSGRAV